MNQIFITSDLHFNHKNIIKYCNRPFDSVEQMNYMLIKKWNDNVGKEDTVIVLGDIGLGGKKNIANLVSQLQGHKRLIMGNHDNFKPKDYIDMGFDWVSPFSVIWQDKYILSHYPMDDVPKGYINLYGHIHTNPNFPTYCKDGICVCCDRFDFVPQTFKGLLDGYKMNNKEYDLTGDIFTFDFNIEDTGLIKKTGKITASVGEGSIDYMGFTAFLYGAKEYNSEYYLFMTVTNSDGSFVIFAPKNCGVIYDVDSSFMIGEGSYEFDTGTESGEIPSEGTRISLAGTYKKVSGELINCTVPLYLKINKKGVAYIVYGDSYTTFIDSGYTLCIDNGDVAYADTTTYTITTSRDDCDFDCTYPN